MRHRVAWPLAGHGERERDLDAVIAESRRTRLGVDGERGGIVGGALPAGRAAAVPKGVGVVRPPAVQLHDARLEGVVPDLESELEGQMAEVPKSLRERAQGRHGHGWGADGIWLDAKGWGLESWKLFFAATAKGSGVVTTRLRKGAVKTARIGRKFPSLVGLSSGRLRLRLGEGGSAGADDKRLSLIH